jgi:hypothetical protein
VTSDISSSCYPLGEFASTPLSEDGFSTDASVVGKGTATTGLSSVTRMNRMYERETTFNSDIPEWDVSRATFIDPRVPTYFAVPERLILILTVNMF